MEGVYLIRDRQSGLHKIGMTTNWGSRKRQLQVGSITTEIRFVQCKNSRKWERVLHSMFKHKRLPQSEWFRISEEEAIPKMNWLSAQTNQQMIVGSWTRAAAGHYYRRRKSSSGNWYTEQKTAYELKQEEERLLEAKINSEQSRIVSQARHEPGYWPTKSDPSKVKWQSSDPTKSQFSPWMFVAVFLGIILIVIMNSKPDSDSPRSRQQSTSETPSRRYKPDVTPERESRFDRQPYEQDQESIVDSQSIADSKLVPTPTDKLPSTDCEAVTQQLLSPKDSREMVSLFEKHKGNCTSSEFKKNAAWHFNQMGVEASEAGLHGASITHYLDAIRLDNDDPQILTNIADAYTHISQYTNAVKYANMALDKNPSFVDAYLTRGVAASWMDKYGDACRDYRHAYSKGSKKALQYMKDASCNQVVQMP